MVLQSNKVILIMNAQEVIDSFRPPKKLLGHHTYSQKTYAKKNGEKMKNEKRLKISQDLKNGAFNTQGRTITLDISSAKEMPLDIPLDILVEKFANELVGIIDNEKDMKYAVHYVPAEIKSDEKQKEGGILYFIGPSGDSNSSDSSWSLLGKETKNKSYRLEISVTNGNKKYLRVGSVINNMHNVLNKIYFEYVGEHAMKIEPAKYEKYDAANKTLVSKNGLDPTMKDIIGLKFDGKVIATYLKDGMSPKDVTKPSQVGGIEYNPQVCENKIPKTIHIMFAKDLGKFGLFNLLNPEKYTC